MILCGGLVCLRNWAIWALVDAYWVSSPLCMRLTVFNLMSMGSSPPLCGLLKELNKVFLLPYPPFYLFYDQVVISVPFSLVFISTVLATLSTPPPMGYPFVMNWCHVSSLLTILCWLGAPKLPLNPLCKLPGHFSILIALRYLFRSQGSCVLIPLKTTFPFLIFLIIHLFLLISPYPINILVSS